MSFHGLAPTHLRLSTGHGQMSKGRRKHKKKPELGCPGFFGIDWINRMVAAVLI
ncbi:hypothetical protein BH24ACI3_BH24ACI3_17600 [soil metagenome]